MQFSVVRAEGRCCEMSRIFAASFTTVLARVVYARPVRGMNKTIERCTALFNAMTGEEGEPSAERGAHMVGWSVALAVAAVVLRRSLPPVIVIGIGSVIVWTAGAYGLFAPRGDAKRLLGYDRSVGAFVTRWPIVVGVAVVGYIVLRWTGHSLHLI